MILKAETKEDVILLLEIALQEISKVNKILDDLMENLSKSSTGKGR